MEIRFFNISETKQLQGAINEIWATNHIFTREEKLLKYMFNENPYRNLFVDENHYSFLGAWKEDTLIGLLGMMAFVLNIQGKKETGCCLTNWIVSPEYRTSGAGLALLNEVQKFNPSIILSLGINQDVAKLYKLLKWSVLEECPRWIGIVNKDKTVNKILDGDVEPLRYWNEVNTIKNTSPYLIEEGINVDKDLWDEFYWNDFAKRSIGFARDYTFLNWRYFNHLSFKYNVITCKDNAGKYKGIAIYRVEEIIDGEKIGRIVEFIASNQESAVALANSIISLNQDILFFDFYCFSSISSWGLEAVGFKKVLKSKEDLLVVPARFQPLDFENTNLMSAMYTTSKFSRRFNLIKDNLWYITKGDSDQDRPN